jgi:3-oxoacyl-[acyl-carrier-protein] synthase III
MLQMSSEGEAATPLLLKDAADWIRPKKVTPNLDLLITVDVPFFGEAASVPRMIGAEKAATFDLRSDCSGFVFGLVTPSQLKRSGEYKTALTIGHKDALIPFLDFLPYNCESEFDSHFDEDDDYENPPQVVYAPQLPRV